MGSPQVELPHAITSGTVSSQVAQSIHERSSTHRAIWGTQVYAGRLSHVQLQQELPWPFWRAASVWALGIEFPCEAIVFVDASSEELLPTSVKVLESHGQYCSGLSGRSLSGLTLPNTHPNERNSRDAEMSRVKFHSWVWKNAMTVRFLITSVVVIVAEVLGGQTSWSVLHAFLP